MREKQLDEWKKIGSYFLPATIKEGIVVSILGALSVFAVILKLANILYGKTPVYSELVVGVTTIHGYNKQADMQIVQFVLLGIIGAFFVFSLLCNITREYTGGEKRPVYFLIGIYVTFLISIYDNKMIANELGVICIVLFGLYLILFWKREESLENYFKLVLITWLLQYLATACLMAMGSVFFEARNLLGQYGILVQIFFLLPALFIAFGVRYEKSVLERASRMIQGFIPLCFLGMFKFYYYYETIDGTMQLFYSRRWKFLCIILTLLFLGYNVYGIWNKRNGIFVTTVISVFAMKTYLPPEGILNIDFFHMGEISMPMQQLVQYRKLPYWDLIPIHGLCDYYYGFINYLFFDGAYLSLNAALVVGNLLLAILMAIIVYAVADKKEIACVAALLFGGFFVKVAGMRYVFSFILFFVLFSKKIRRNILSYLWCWVFSSIIAIAWNASIGGACALAFFPVVVYRVIRELPQEIKKIRQEKGRRRRGRVMLAYAALLSIGICFIPLFLQIVLYLKDNTATTVMVNGMEMIQEFSEVSTYFTPSVVTNGTVSFLQIFSFLIPLLFMLLIGIMEKEKDTKKVYLENFVIFFLYFFVIANYAFVRFDEGLRTKMIGIFFLFLVVFTVLKERYAVVLGIFLATALLLVDERLVIFSETVLAAEVIPESVETEIMEEILEESVVYVTGNSVDMPGMGNGFVRGNTLRNLQNVNYVLDQELEEAEGYLDLTNQIAHYVVLGRENVLPYTSGYNISNRAMQEKAIALLEETRPKLVLISPHIQFDETPFSLRSMRLYEYLLEAGYEPCLYQNVCYLIRSEEGNPIPPCREDGRAYFASLMHKENMGALPAIWAESPAKDTLTPIEVPYAAIEMQKGVLLQFDTPIDGNAVSFVEIVLLEEGGMKEEGQISVSFLSSLKGDNVQLKMERKENSYLIPVGSSPYWKLEAVIGSMEINEKNIAVFFYK